MEEKKSTTNKNVEDGKVCAILTYLLIGVIWYFADEKMKKNDFVKFHVKQAIVLFIVSLAGSIVLGMTIVLAWLLPLYQVAIFVLMVVGIINASNGQKKELPFIGRFGEKFNF